MNIIPSLLILSANQKKQQESEQKRKKESVKDFLSENPNFYKAAEIAKKNSILAVGSDCSSCCSVEKGCTPDICFCKPKILNLFNKNNFFSEIAFILDHYETIVVSSRFFDELKPNPMSKITNTNLRRISQAMNTFCNLIINSVCIQIAEEFLDIKLEKNILSSLDLEQLVIKLISGINLNLKENKNLKVIYEKHSKIPLEALTVSFAGEKFGKFFRMLEGAECDKNVQHILNTFNKFNVLIEKDNNFKIHKKDVLQSKESFDFFISSVILYDLFRNKADEMVSKIVIVPLAKNKNEKLEESKMNNEAIELIKEYIKDSLQKKILQIIILTFALFSEGLQTSTQK